MEKQCDAALSFDFFKTSSRLGRVRYLGLFSLWLSVWIVGVLLFQAFPNYGFLWKAMIGILFVVGAINLLFLQIRRLHDFDYRGWWLLLGGIPLLGQLLTLAIFFIPGSTSSNRFGNPPPKPSIMDYLLIGATPLVYCLSFLLRATLSDGQLFE